MNKFLMLFGMLICIPLCFAQTKSDPFYINYQIYPAKKLNFEEAETNVQILEANAILPNFNLSKKTKVNTQLNYKSTTYSYTDATIELKQFHDFRLGLIIRQELGNSWELLARPQLNLRSDLSEDALKNGIFPSFALLGIKTNKSIPSLSYGLGVSYNNDIDKNAITPLAYLNFTSNQFRINAILPSLAHFIFTPSKNFEYGVSYQLSPAIYHIDNKNGIQFLKTSSMNFTPTIGYQFFQKLWINAKAGYSINRKWEGLDGDFNNLSSKGDKIHSGFTAAIGLSMRME